MDRLNDLNNSIMKKITQKNKTIIIIKGYEVRISGLAIHVDHGRHSPGRENTQIS